MKSILKKVFMCMIMLCIMVFIGSGFINVKAEDEFTVTYTFGGSSKTGWTVAATGDVPEESSATYTQTYSTLSQMTGSNSLTLTITGFEGYVITQLSLSMHSNASSGTGKFSLIAGSTTISEIAENTGFNKSAWNGEWSKNYVDITPTMKKDDYIIKANENVVLTISASANSLFCESVTFTYEAAPNEPGVELSGSENVYLENGTYNYTATPLNVVATSTTYTSSNIDVATITNAGILTPVSIGSTNITATVNDTYESSPLAIKVWPKGDSVISIADALKVAELTGSTKTNDKYIACGTVASIEENTFILSDGINSIKVYYHGHTFTVDQQIKVYGTLINYNNTTKEFNSDTTLAYDVSFNTNGGNTINSQIIGKGNKVINPETPIKDGFTFLGWYKEEALQNEFDFDNDTISSNTTLYAKWHNDALDGIQTELNNINSWFSMGYAYDVNVSEADPDYVKVTSVNDVADGDSVIIVSKYDDTYYALSNSVSNNISSGVEVTISNDKILSTVSDTIKWTVNGDNVSGWTLKNGTNYVDCTSSSVNFKLSASTTNKLTLTYTSATKCLFGFSSRALFYREDALGFKNYSTGGFNSSDYATEAYVFVKKSAVTTYDNVDFRIKVGIDADVAELEGILKYGIKVSTSSKSKEYEFNVDTKESNGVKYIVIDLEDALTNSERLGEEFTITAYVLADGEKLYSTATKTASIYSLVKAYYDQNIEEVLGLVEILDGFGYDFD